MKADVRYHLETLENIFSNAPCGVGVFDAQTMKPMFLNNAYYRMIEYTPQEYEALIEGHTEHLVYDEGRDIAEVIRRELLENGSVSEFEYQIIKKHHGISTIRASISTIEVDDRPCALCYFEDIAAERKQLEQTKLVVDNTDSSISLLRLNVKDSTVELVYANDTFFKMLGGSREEYIAKPNSLLTLVPEQDVEGTREAIQRSIITGKPQEIEYRLMQSDHTSRWMNRHLYAVKQDEENVYLMYSIVTDITDRKNAEHEREMEQQTYQNVLDNMPTGFMKIKMNADGSSEPILFNQAFCKMTDMTTEQCMNLYRNSFLAGVHPDDLKHVTEIIKNIHDGSRLTATYRIRKSTDSWTSVRSSIYAKDEDGTLMLYNNYVDISGDIEQKVRTNALLDSLLGVIIYKVTDDSIITQYCSDSIENLSGYSAVELQQQIRDNRLFENSIYPPDYKRTMNLFHGFAKEKKPAKFTYRSYKKGGLIQWLSLSGTLIREENGYPVYYCVLTLPPAESSLYQGVVEDAAGAIFIIERNTRYIIYINREGRKIYDIPQNAEVTGSSILNYSRDGQLLLNTEEIVTLSSNHYSIFHKLSHNHRYYAIRAKALDWNGIDSYIVYAVDETQEYSKSQQREFLLNQIPVGIGIYEVSKQEIKQIYMSDGFYQMLHVSKEKHKAIIGNTFLRGVYPDDLGQIEFLTGRLLAGSNSGAAEFRNLCYDDIYLWVRLVANVVKRSDDSITVYCVYEDISEEVVARENLKKMNVMLQRQYEIEQKKHEFLKRDSICTMVFNESQDQLIELKAPEKYSHILIPGLTKDECIEQLFKLIPDPDDQLRIRDYFDTKKTIALFKSGVTDKTTETRLRRMDGCLHWTKADTQIVEDQNNGDIISYTFASDIDEEKVRTLVSESIISDETDFIVLLSTITRKARVLRVRSNYEC